VDAPASAPAPASASAWQPGPPSQLAPHRAAAERAFIARVQALASGGDLAALWRELPRIEREILDTPGEPSGLRELVSRSAGFLITCQAVREGTEKPCERAAVMGERQAASCRARAILFGSLLPALAERRPCDAAAVARAAALMKVPAAEVTGVCNAVAAREPGSAPGWTRRSASCALRSSPATGALRIAGGARADQGAVGLPTGRRGLQRARDQEAAPAFGEPDLRLRCGQDGRPERPLRAGVQRALQGRL